MCFQNSLSALITFLCQILYYNNAIYYKYCVPIFARNKNYLLGHFKNIFFDI